MDPQASLLQPPVASEKGLAVRSASLAREGDTSGSIGPEDLGSARELYTRPVSRREAQELLTRLAWSDPSGRMNPGLVLADLVGEFQSLPDPLPDVLWGREFIRVKEAKLEIAAKEAAWQAEREAEKQEASAREVAWQ